MADATKSDPPKMLRKKSGVNSKKDATQKQLKSKTSDAKSEAPGVKTLDEKATSAPSQPEGADNKTATEYQDQSDSGVDGLTTSDDDDEASEVALAGSVNAKGDVVNEGGKIIGKVSGENASQLEGSMVDFEGDVLDEEGNVIGHADMDSESLKELDPKPPSEDADESEAGTADKSVVTGTAGGLKDTTKPDLEGSEKPDLEGLKDTDKSDIDGAEKTDLEGTEKDLKDTDKPEFEGIQKPELTGPFSVQDNGEITNVTSEVVGKLAEGTPQDFVGTSIKEIDEEGNLVAKSGSVIGKADIVSNLLDKANQADIAAPELLGPFSAGENGEITNAKGDVVANLPEGEDLDGKTIKSIDEEGQIMGASGSVIGNADLTYEDLQGLDKAGSEVGSKLDDAADVAGEADPKEKVPKLSLLEGMKVNKAGKIVDAEGNPQGLLVEGDAKKLNGKKVDGEGKIWDDSGNVIGRAELLPEDERVAEVSAPFEDFLDNVLDAKGNVIFEGKVVGKLTEGDGKKLEGKKVDADGDVLDKNGNTLGKAERYQEEEEVPQEEQHEDLSQLEGKKVNKAGNVVDDSGKLFGHVNSGALAKLVGKKCDAEGKIWSDSGKVIGTAELIPLEDRDEESTAPFEDFPDATVNSKGDVIFEDKIIGKLIEGDAKKLAGKKVDKDGEVVDKIGNVLGKAERYEEPEEPEAVKIDQSALAGKRVNKAGNVVDSQGEIYGKLVEGDAAKLAGKMCDKDGNVWNEGGTVVGRAEIVPESERSGQKEGPFSGFASPTITKEGKVADARGNIIGRLIEGEAMKLYGKAVDADGDVVDKNGNTVGKAERWEEEVKEKKKSPIAGRKINRDGNVLDDDGDVIAKLVDGEIGKCIGKEIDDDGDLVNSKGTTLGHVSLLDDIPAQPEPEVEPEPVEPEETPEEAEAKRQLENDRKLANQMASAVQNCIENIKPILTMITDAIESEERKDKAERDEQKLVDTVKPLIEQASGILQEANGVIRGLDPDGRIAGNAKGRAASREATPEEYHLADVLKDLTENVHKTIEQAKKKIAGMPHAEKQLNPLWALLMEPLGQILAAVGLLLAGVLGLVGKLLSGLGLGGLLDNLLGGLGLKNILGGLGLGFVTDSLTGKKKK
ncbi:hypothetical protein BJ875DRAFT_455344 [Amylocarpus encephaloides]|uniref:DUF6987 domain-containing protein n=1 Tax=Amylocarpus encephaloides TaxID=45428 RepID=A0A9P8C7I6_9HELO|nr:hypothetical protein BJ875DRAFT_455344 [Amylocarpus encephaloides]